MRLFIAALPSKETLDGLRDVLRKYDKFKRNLKVPPVDQLHITLKYIGSKVSENSYEIIREELKRYEHNIGACDVEFDGVKFGFSFDRDPRILMADVVASDGLLNLSNSFHELVKNLKLRDTIRYKGKYSNDFHITLARLKETATRSSGKELKAHTAQSKFKISGFKIEEVFLIESSFSKSGQPVYKKLEKIIL